MLGRSGRAELTRITNPDGIVRQQDNATGRIDSHEADEGLQEARIETRALLCEHLRQRFVRRQGLVEIGRIAQVVIDIDQSDQARQRVDRFALEPLRIAAAVEVFVVLEKRFSVRPEGGRPCG